MNIESNEGLSLPADIITVIVNGVPVVEHDVMTDTYSGRTPGQGTVHSR